MPPEETASGATQTQTQQTHDLTSAKGFMAAMEAHGGFGDNGEDEEGGARETEATAEASGGSEQAEASAKDGKEATETKPAEKKPGKRIENAGGDERAQLEELAKKLGMEVEGGRVSHREWIQLRQAKQKFKQAQEEREAALKKEIEEREKAFFSKAEEVKGTLKADVEFAKSVKKAYEDGDPEALAKLLGAEGWDKVQESFIARLADPNYKRLRQLEEERAREKKEREEAEVKAQRERQEAEAKAKQEAEQKQRSEAVRQYQAKLSEQMKASKDPLVAALADIPGIVNAVFRVQDENWDPETKRTVSPEQAIRTKFKNGAIPVFDELKTMYERLHKVFGGGQENPQKKPKPRTADTRPSTEASPPGKFRDRNDYLKHMEKALAEADDW